MDTNMYYIDGFDLPFGSFLEIRDFLLNLSEISLLYLFTLDRYVYYGNISDNMFMCCGYFQVKHPRDFQKGLYGLYFVRCDSYDRYVSACITPFARIFINMSNRTTKSPKK